MLQIIIASTVLFIEISRTFYVCLPIVHKMAPTWGLWRGGGKKGPPAPWEGDEFFPNTSIHTQDKFEVSSRRCPHQNMPPPRHRYLGRDPSTRQLPAVEAPT